MFRRRWSGLPADPAFPSNLEGLGYFIHTSDEIRAIDDHDSYFGYWAYKGDRWNDRRLFAMNEAVRGIVLKRLASLGLKRLPLPLGAVESEPHVPILTTGNLDTKKRTVVVFGESSQSLGVISAMATKLKGGIDKNSAVGLVRGLLAQRSSADDPSPPGVVLANPGELWWWPGGRRGLTQLERHAAPMASAVHIPAEYNDRINGIPENRTEAEHVRYVFERVLKGKGKGSGKVDVIAVGDMADVVEQYLNDDATWEEMGGILGSMVVLGGFYHVREFKCGGFARFMEERARAYTIHQSPVDTLIAGPGGNPESVAFTAFGCPLYSAGEKCIRTDTLLIDAQQAVLKWMQQMALEGDGYPEKFQPMWDAKRAELKSQMDAEQAKEGQSAKRGKEGEGVTTEPVEEVSEATKQDGNRTN